MKRVGRIDEVWRYPVKSMAGEALEEAFITFAGILGDRLYAIRSSSAVKGFPYLTGRQRPAMLGYRPRFRHAERSLRPDNLAEAEALGPGVTPAYPDADDLALDIVTPDGVVLAMEDPRLLAELGQGAKEGQTLSLLRSDRALTDCRPVSLISQQTVRTIAAEAGPTVDRRRFRANLCADLEGMAGFAEDAFVGRSLRIGARATIAVLERDARCQMISIDPDSLEPDKEVLRAVAKNHGGCAGVYAAVLVEGVVRPGDEILLLD